MHTGVLLAPRAVCAGNLVFNQVRGDCMVLMEAKMAPKSTKDVTRLLFEAAVASAVLTSLAWLNNCLL